MENYYVLGLNQKVFSAMDLHPHFDLDQNVKTERNILAPCRNCVEMAVVTVIQSRCKLGKLVKLDPFLR